jgi:ATP-dependent Clp protease protease subunit
MDTNKIPNKDAEEVMEVLLGDMPSTLDEIFQINEYKERIMYVGSVDFGMAQSIVATIIDYNTMDKGLPVESRLPIKMYINSMGGVFQACYSIIDAIQLSITPVHTINIGAAYSAGAEILIAGHKRSAFKHASFLLHEGSNGFQADAGKFKDYTRFYERQLESAKDFIVAHTLITDDQFERKRHADWWMDSEEMLSFGIIDEIVTSL